MSIRISRASGKSFTKTRTLGLLLASAVALAPASALISTAHAQTAGGETLAVADVGGNKTAPISLIDADKPTTLSIQKYLGDPVTNESELENMAPLGDITFTVYQLEGMNPKDAADWEAYSKLDASTLTAGEGMTKATSVTTDGSGFAKTGELPVGFYYVVEESSAGVVPAPPFLISLPMTDTVDLDQWNYHPTVKPKNQKLDLVKSLQDEDIVEDDQNLTYTLTADVPALATAGGSYNRLVIIDDYDENYIALDASAHVVRLVDGGDVKATLVAEDYTVVDADGKVTMSLTASGLTKLAEFREGNPGLQVAWDLSGKIIGFNAAGEGKIFNDAVYQPPHAPNVEVGDIPSNEVVTEMVKINLAKVDGDTAKALEGAEFDLYRCELGTNKLINDENLGGILDSGVTDSSGSLSFKSVQIPSFADNAERAAAYDYCVVETKAPVGYELVPEPIKVDLVSLDKNLVTIEVENWEANGGNPLPVTGENALLLLAAGGAGLIIIGGAAYVMRRRTSTEV